MTDAAKPVDGRYRLVRPIAKVTSGGHGYAAEHVFTHRSTALKVLDRGAPDKVRKRMRREMEALAAAQGPGVVEFRDAGESDGRLYIALELLEGRTLAGLLAAKTRLDVDQTLKVGVAVADVLARCHDRGVVHRDVKPANLFVTMDERVQVLDFGIAKVLAPRSDPEKLTQENMLLGTPEYMAPEALLSSPDVGEHADQCSLGVTLYECLTGVVPFEGPYGEVIRKISATSLRAVEELRPETPRALAQVIGRALGRRPEDRHTSMGEMCEALRGAAGSKAGAPLLQQSPSRAAWTAPTVADSPAANARTPASRRRHARTPYLTLAHLRRDDGAPADGRIEEVSESGFQFVGGHALMDGETVRARFALPVTGRIVEATATCRWTRSTRGLTAAGFEVGHLPDDAVAEIRKYVSLMAVE